MSFVLKNGIIECFWLSDICPRCVPIKKLWKKGARILLLQTVLDDLSIDKS